MSKSLQTCGIGLSEVVVDEAYLLWCEVLGTDLIAAFCVGEGFAQLLATVDGSSEVGRSRFLGLSRREILKRDAVFSDHGHSCVCLLM